MLNVPKNDNTFSLKPNNKYVILVNNAGAFIFDSVAYEFHRHMIKYVRDPGHVNSIR